MFPVEKQYRQYIYYKSLSDLSADASKTYLSFFWWLLEPVVMLFVFYVVFGILMQRAEGDFVPFLLIGVVVVQWFNHSISASMMSISSRKTLLNQVHFPKLILPSAVFLTVTIKFLMVFSLLLVYLSFSGYPLTLSAFQLLPLFVVSFYLIWAGSCFCALLVTYVPDFQHVIPHCVRLLTYLSGVFYSIDSLPKEYAGYFKWNPVAMIIDACRDVILGGLAIDYSYFLMLAVLVVILCVYVVYIFRAVNFSLASVVGQQ